MHKLGSTSENNFFAAEWDVTSDRSETKPEQWINTICGFCGSGCGMQVGLKHGEVTAVRGRADYPVNFGRLCLKGFYQYKAMPSPQRATVPMVRKNGALVPVSWEEALEVCVTKMQQSISAGGPEAVGIYNTGQMTLEEYYAIGKLARGFIGTPNIDASLRLCMASASHALIRAFGADGTPGCYEDLDLADCILIFGCNTAEMFPEIWHRIRMRQKKGARLLVVDPRRTPTARAADLHLQIMPGQNVPLLKAFINVLFRKGLVDGSFVNSFTSGWEELRNSVKEVTPEYTAETVGIPAEKIREAAEIFGEASRATTIFMQGVFQSISATDAANLILNMHLLTGNIGKPGSSPLALTGQANSMGSREAGGAASFVGMRNPLNPVHRKEVAEAWDVDEKILPQKTNDVFSILDDIENGEVQVLWNIASNPAVSLPDLSRVHQLLEKVFLIVQDIYYPMETAKFADVILPAAGWGEKTGVFTNSERRVNLVEKFQQPPGEAKSDLEIIQLLASKLGYEESFCWSGPEEVFEEWKELSADRPCDMRGISYRRLKKSSGIQWPCPNADHPGTPRLYVEGKFNTASHYSQNYGDFNSGESRARMHAVDNSSISEMPNSQYPFWLNTGRLLEHYHTRTKTKRVPELNRLIPDAFVEISSMDALKLGIQADERVKLISPRGSIELPVKITDAVLPGQLFAPFHFGDLDPGEDHSLRAVNRLLHNQRDSISLQPMLKLSVCRVEKIESKKRLAEI